MTRILCSRQGNLEHVKTLLEKNHKCAIRGLVCGAQDQATDVNWLFVGYDVMLGT